MTSWLRFGRRISEAVLEPLICESLSIQGRMRLTRKVENRLESLCSPGE